MIGKQDLECDGELRVHRYGSRYNQSFDGIHMRGSFAQQHMTKTFVNMMVNIFPHLNPINPRVTNLNPTSAFNLTGGNKTPMGALSAFF